MSVKLWLSISGYIRGFEIPTEVFRTIGVTTDLEGKIHQENSSWNTEEWSVSKYLETLLSAVQTTKCYKPGYLKSRSLLLPPLGSSKSNPGCIATQQQTVFLPYFQIPVYHRCSVP